MATGATPHTSAPPPAPPAARAASREYIDEQLARTRQHLRWLDVAVGVVGWLTSLVVFLLLAACVDHWIVPLSATFRWFALVGLLALTAGAFWRWILPPLMHRVNPAYAAKVIEQRGERLHNSLLNYLFLRNQRAGVTEVVYQSIEQRAAGDLQRVPWEQVMDHSRAFRWAYGFAAVLAIVAAYKIVSPKDPLRTFDRVLRPWAELTRPSRVELRDIQPGDVKTFHGRPLVVSADVRGMRQSETPRVVFSTADGQTIDEVVSLTKSADGLRYEATVPPGRDGVRQNLRYRVEAGDAVSREFQVEVLPAPTMVVERIEYDPPRYTGLPRSVVEQRGDVRGLEGTKVTIHARASLPIKSATLEFDPTTAGQGPPDPTRMAPMNVDGASARITFNLQLKPDRRTPWRESYQVRFVTPDGVASESPILHTIEVEPDLPPEIEFLAPRQTEITLRVDQTLPVEARAIDPDFGITSLTLFAQRDGEFVAEERLVEHAQGLPGQVVAKYEFAPKKLRLQPGDEVLLWCEVADNRVDWKTGKSAPQRQRTSTIKVHIAAGDPTKPSEKPTDANSSTTTGQPEEPTPPDSQNPSGTPAQKPGKAVDSQDPATSKPTTAPKTGAQSGSKEKNGGSKQNTGSGSKPKTGDASSENEKPNTKPGDAQGQKPNESQGQKPGDQPGEKPGEKPGQKTGDMSGDMPGEKPGDKPGEKPGDSSGTESKPGDQPGEKPGGKPSSKSDGSSGGQQGSKPSEKPSSPSSSDSSGGNSKDPQAGKTQSGDPKQPSESPAGKDGKQDGGKGKSGSAGTSSAKPNDPPSGASGADDGSGSSDSNSNPAGSNSPGSSGSAPNGSGQSTANASDSNTGKPSGSPNGQQSGKPAGSPSGQQTSKPSGNAAGKPSSKADGSAAKPESSPSNSQNSSGEPAGEMHDGDVFQKALEHMKDRQGGTGKPTSKPNDNSPNSENPPLGKPSGSGANDSPSGRPEGGTETKPETEPNGRRPSEKSPGAGTGQNGKAGAGEKPEKPNGGAPSPLTPPQDRDKTQSPDNKQAAGGDETATPSESKKQSDSKGGAGGDRSGGGKQGGGQGAKQAGNDSAGGSSPGDEGSGAAQQPGQGPDGTQGGAGKPTDKPTGKPGGNDRGAGSATTPGKNGDARPQGPPNAPNDTKPTPGSPANQGAPSGATGSPNGSGPRTPSTGGGKPGDGSRGSSGPAGDVPEGDEANLDYARKATDLVLEYLKDQRDNPDAELLNKLGWSPEDLRNFLDRWQQMKQAADRQDPQARHELDESLKSLGLRSGRTQPRAAGAAADTVRGNRDDGQRSSPPARYLEQFKAYRKGTSRTEVQGQ